MSIQPVKNNINFLSKDKTTEKGNKYKETKIAETAGLASGLVIGSTLVTTQMKALNTIQGKRNLIAGFMEKGQSLLDVFPKKRGVNRAKIIAKQYRSTLLWWAAGITAVTTIVGKLIDANINASRAKKADESNNANKPQNV